MAVATTRGVLFVHSSPPSLRPHLEWAIGRCLGRPVHLSWEDQPVLPGTLRAEFPWKGPIGTGSEMASALRGWEHLRFEVSEQASPGVDGGRWMHTPDLGIFYGAMDTAGNTMMTEDRVKTALAEGGGDPRQITKALRLAWGGAWDDELEPFRYCSEDTGVVWFHRVG